MRQHAAGGALLDLDWADVAFGLLLVNPTARSVANRRIMSWWSRKGRAVDDCAPGCLPGFRPVRRRSDRSLGFFLYRLSGLPPGKANMR